MKELGFENSIFKNHFKEIDLRDILQNCTPLFLYSAETIRDRYEFLKHCIKWKDVNVFYAMKANYHPEILKYLCALGSGIDAVSPAEVFLALKCGFTPDKIIFTSNNNTDNEIEEIMLTGVLVNIDSLSRLEKFGKKYKGSSICIRFNSDVVAGEHVHIQTGGAKTKFGILFSDVPRILEISHKNNLKIIGIHNHTGSGISDQGKFIESMNNMLSIINKSDFPDLEFVDFGGGFKAQYKINENFFDYKEFGRVAGNLFSNFCAIYGRSLQLYIEPGKFLTSESGIFVVQVNTIKNNRGRLIAGVNSGFPHFPRPILYNAYHHIVNITNPKGKILLYDVCGNICESGDCFASDREIPEIREGDFLAIMNAGAYCYSMASIYNMRPLPKELFLNQGVITQSKNLSDKELADVIFANYGHNPIGINY